MHTEVIVIGAGPAGLSAAYFLAKANKAVIVLEADPHYVGGIARTVNYKGYCFDIGGHRFFSKSAEVEQFWNEVLPDDMLERPRSSRIFYRGKFFSYPLKAFDALFKLGIVESTLCVISYFKAKVFPIKNPRTFADWVINHFGHRLYKIFFKTYTEKVWGMSCHAISADWAAQRIRGLSLFTAIKNALLPQRKHRTDTIKTLIDHFRYPRKGPGMLWDACAQKIRDHGGKVLLGCAVYRCEYHETEKMWYCFYHDESGNIEIIQSRYLISSAALRDLVTYYLQPGVSEKTLLAASRLCYRDFLIVVLILKDKNIFNDNWIYVHDKKVDVARIQNFKSWSPEMVPYDDYCSYGMEYFCQQGDPVWSLNDAQLIEKASDEIVKLKLAKRSDIVDGCVVRQCKAYPVYDHRYQDNVAKIRDELSEKFPSLHLVGRNGMHKYNNQDHAIMTAMLTVKNILANEQKYDVWHVNQDAEYHEEGNAKGAIEEVGLRQVPQPLEQTD